MASEKYADTALNVEQLLIRLKNKGLIVKDYEHASFCLRTVGYHRLSSYFDSFKFYHLSEWKFKPLISFDSIWKFYVFDRELRLLVMDALERIEIAFRTALSDTMSLLYEPHWYLNRELFKNIELHDVLLKQITEICRYRNDDQHIKKYYGQYSHPDFPPSWIIMEFLSFGACLSTFQNLKKLNDKKAICRLLTYHPVAIESWMAALRYTRNLCAHHSRLWNRWFVIIPKLRYLYGEKFNKERTFYAQAIVINRLLRVVSPTARWQQKLYSLFNNNRFVPVHKMGFMENWCDDPFWTM